jgi:hypothetical protein
MHLATKKLRRQAIRAELIIDNGSYQYGTMVANIWQEKKKLMNDLFDKTLIARQLDICYFDIPDLHEFSEHGHVFFDHLAVSEQMDIFSVRIVQIIITHKWKLIGNFIKYGMFVPYLTLLMTNLIWHWHFRPVRSKHRVMNRVFGLAALVEVGYFMFIEYMQAKDDLEAYMLDRTNYQNVLPLYTVAQSVLISIVKDEP